METESLEFCLAKLMNKHAGVVHVKSQIVAKGIEGAVELNANDIFGKFFQSTTSTDLAALHNCATVTLDNSPKDGCDGGQFCFLAKPTQRHLLIRTLTGQQFLLCMDGEDSIENLKARVQNSQGIPPDQQRLIYVGKQMEDGRKIIDYVRKPDAELHLVLRLRGGGCPTYYMNINQLFDPKWNFDFSRITTDTASYKRGERVYTRPLGAVRYAIKVLGKYADGNEKWLGLPGNRTDSADGEWPVAYHHYPRERHSVLALSGNKRE